MRRSQTCGHVCAPLAAICAPACVVCARQRERRGLGGPRSSSAAVAKQLPPHLDLGRRQEHAWGGGQGLEGAQGRLVWEGTGLREGPCALPPELRGPRERARLPLGPQNSVHYGCLSLSAPL